MIPRNAKRLSSCNDASKKQEQKMNVKINLEDTTPTQTQLPVYPQVQPVNVTTPQQTVGELSQFPSIVTNLNTVKNRNIDLTKDILQQEI